MLAADDFLLFKEAMVRRNIDLELQALTLLKKQMGQSPVVYDTDKTGDDPVKSPKKSAEDEEKMLQEAMKMSEAQYDLERSMDDEQLQRLIEQAKRESLQLYQQQQMEQEKGGEEGVSLVKTSSVQEASPRGSQHITTSTSSGPEQGVHLEEEKVAQPNIQSGHPETETMKETVSQTTVLPPLVVHTHPLPTMKSTGEKMSVTESGVESSGDAMAKWLEGAKSHPHSDPSQTANAASSLHTTLSSVSNCAPILLHTCIASSHACNFETFHRLLPLNS